MKPELVFRNQHFLPHEGQTTAEDKLKAVLTFKGILEKTEFENCIQISFLVFLPPIADSLLFEYSSRKKNRRGKMTENKLETLKNAVGCLSHHLTIRGKELSMTACGGCDEYALCRELFHRVKERDRRRKRDV
ncbi:hypothetical protein DRJ17_05795 [Candidatus Woesearchaeota archaeon]|nr:MAG: hypothetical protein DRJ17_05795 [Candidatus Woesearchaeota archaeon]